MENESNFIPKLNYFRTIYTEDVQNYTHYYNTYGKVPIIESTISIPLHLEYKLNNNVNEYMKEVSYIFNFLENYFNKYPKIELSNDSYMYDAKYNGFTRHRGGFLYTYNEGQIIFSALYVDEMLLFKIFTQEKNNHYYFLVDEIQDIVKNKKLKFRNNKSTCNIIVRQGGNFSLRCFDIPQVPFDIINYNDDIIDIVEHIDHSLRTKSKGIVLLHGEMGTGKTSYLRTLMNMHIDKNIIYVPPDMASSLASPDIISFLESECNDSIIIIEDAENVLQTREAGGNQAVSNILNTSDGILGDILKIQFVCTFNSTLEMIDPALRRPGRLIAEYEFKKLTVNKTAALIKKLYDVEYTENKEMTLAEVYNYAKVLYKTKEKEKVFGFIN